MGKGHEGLSQIKSILRALLAALTTLSSILRLVLKAFPRSIVVDTFGTVSVLGGLMGERV